MTSKSEIAQIRKVSAGLEALALLREGTEKDHICKWPGHDAFEFVIVVLLDDQRQEAMAGAVRQFENMGLEVGLYTSDEWWNEINTQVLYLAMRDITDPTCKKRLFDSADEVRSALKRNERDVITNEYTRLMGEANPTELSQQVFDQIEDMVKKKDAVGLAALSSAILSIYMLTTVAQSAS